MKNCRFQQSSNKRFQRLESHVVTLARSVAHLSSEMRTQHIMIQVWWIIIWNAFPRASILTLINAQEMETIRSEIAQLRAHPLRMGSGNPYNTGASCKLPRGFRVDRDTCWQGAVPALTDPSRVKKLTSFFGDEPPLLRIFLKKLGYEVKYANFNRFVYLVFSRGSILNISEIRATIWPRKNWYDRVALPDWGAVAQNGHSYGSPNSYFAGGPTLNPHR